MLQLFMGKNERLKQLQQRQKSKTKPLQAWFGYCFFKNKYATERAEAEDVGGSSRRFFLPARERFKDVGQKFELNHVLRKLGACFGRLPLLPLVLHAGWPIHNLVI